MRHIWGVLLMMQLFCIGCLSWGYSSCFFKLFE
jgi:hypothetical protein